ncbi:hypothetical protein M0802_014002 [Mischocyttarus mexicanus]|nr:hypothetical protein M0802_014002 [Mischocyttarus mexicanus]
MTEAEIDRYRLERREDELVSSGDWRKAVSLGDRRRAVSSGNQKGAGFVGRLEKSGLIGRPEESRFHWETGIIVDGPD